MNKLVRIFTLLLCLTLLLGSVPLALAQESQQVLQIHTVEDFLRFAQDCRLDTYSQNITVVLCCTVDLTGKDFEPIASFSGTFEGNGHTIQGLTLTNAGSSQGLFRYLTETAVVRDLHVRGTVTPAGSASQVGGIVGSNAGRLEKCSFTGLVSGSDYVGGIAGTNALSGMIENCRVSGTVHGSHFTGGIAGENLGVLRRCSNSSQVNTTAEQNSIALEDITLDSLMDTESAATVTDIGGIAGSSSGVIRECENLSSVGYPLIGYNIGGIAGSSSGYITGCTNRGNVEGRKEAGGIAGQLIPAVSMRFEEDAIQTLRQQMDTMSSLTSQASGRLQSSAGVLQGQFDSLKTQLGIAHDAMDSLIPDREDPSLPDLDAIQAAQNALSSSMSSISGTLNSMGSATESALGSSYQSIQAISHQMNIIGGTLSNAQDNLGGTVADVSDADTEADTTAKIENCRNLARVSGDLNIGGIVGAIAFENTMDPEEDLYIDGSVSANFDCQFRAVVLHCENGAAITGKKQNVGGIVGWMTMGLAKGCVNMAQVEAAAADYVGGIAGKAQGAIRLCAHRGAVSGSTYVGGIAGTAQAITDCAALVALTNPSECFGGILGSGDTALLSGNHYLSAGADPGGVDGISYDGIAQALEAAAFFALENVPQEYSSVTLRFVLDENTTETLVLPYGTRLESSHFPTLPDKSGTESAWEGTLHPGDPVHFDSVIRAVYTSRQYTLESALVDRLGRPLLLAQGDFLPEARVELEKLDTEAIEAWTLELPHSDTSLKLRYLLPKDHGADAVALEGLVEEQWIPLDFTAQGSYLVFTAPEGLRAIRLNAVEPEPSPYLLPAILGGAVLLTVLVVVLAVRRKKKKSAPQPDPQTPALP